MDIQSADYKQLLKFIELASVEGATHEFEFRLRNVSLDRFQFTNIIQRFLRMGFTVQETDTLDIQVTDMHDLEGFRYHLSDKARLLTYCRTNALGSGPHHVDKKTLSEHGPVELLEYNLRASLKKEVAVTETQVVDGFVTAIENTASTKFYRYKKRFSLSSSKSVFRLDATVVKSSVGKGNPNFASSGVLSSVETFEVELEFVPGTPREKKVVLNEGLTYVAEVLKVVHSSEWILKASEKEAILKRYLALTNQKANLDIVRKNAKAYFVGPQNVALELRNVVEPDIDVVTVQHGYTVTDKSDGERTLVYVDSDKAVYTINNRLDIRYTGMKHTAVNSLLDCEYIARNKLGGSLHVLLAFDIYYHKGESVLLLPLISPEPQKEGDSRVGFIKDMVQRGFTKDQDWAPRILAKEFRAAEGVAMFAECNTILNNYKVDKIEHEIDGLIFTPISGQANLKDMGSRTFKWKPPRDNTIDFLVEFEDDVNVNMTNVNKLHRRVNLIVGFRPGSDAISPLDVINQVKPADANQYVRRVFAKCYLPVENDGRVLTTKTAEPILNGMVVEMAYDLNQESELLRWYPKLIRHDKNELLKKTGRISGTANDYHVAVKTLRTIKNPVTEAIITGKEPVNKDTIVNMEDVYYNRVMDRKTSPLAPMLLFHNSWVKNERLLQLFRKKHYKLFDFGVGKGGDLNKWFNAEYSVVVGADVVEDNILSVGDGAYRRYQEKLHEINENAKRGMRAPNTKALFLVMDGGTRWTKEYVDELSDEKQNQFLARVAFGRGKQADVPKALKPFHNIMNDGFDVASCQFAIHYFFKDRATLSSFAENLNSILKVGGYFVGTCMDGEAVHRKLENLPIGGKVEGKVGDRTLWMIIKEYDDFVLGQSIGKKIKNYIETINKIFDEYLVDMPLLEEVLGQYNIRLITKHDSDALGLPGPSGLFEGSYAEMTAAYLGNKQKYAYLKNATEMSPVSKEYSFLNRWFVFRKYAS